MEILHDKIAAGYFDRSAAQTISQRCRVSRRHRVRLLLEEGMPPRDVAKNLEVSVPTLYRWLPASGR